MLYQLSYAHHKELSKGAPGESNQSIIHMPPPQKHIGSEAGMPGSDSRLEQI